MGKIVRTRGTAPALALAVALLAASCAQAGVVADDTVGNSIASAVAAEVADEVGSEVVDAQPDPQPEPTATPEPEPTDTPEPEPEAVGFDAVDEFAEQVVADFDLDGASLIVVHRDDGVIHNAHYGSFEPGRISLIASSSKMISAGVLLHLQEQGLLDIDAPIAAQTEWSNTYDVTPAQLVSNSSGLVGLGPDLLYFPYLCQWSPTSTLDECSAAVLETENDDLDVAEPEAEFRYGGAQWQVAGGVAESVSGQSWAELITDIYVDNCGVDTLGYLSLGQVLGTSSGPGYPTSFGGDPGLHDVTENPNIEGGAYISTDDYAKLLLMHLRGGECENGTVFSQASLDTMHADRMAALGLDAGEAGTGYGMGWWVDRDTGIISDPGAWGAFPWLNLADGYGAYWLIEDQGATTNAISEELRELVHVAITGESLS